MRVAKRLAVWQCPKALATPGWGLAPFDPSEVAGPLFPNHPGNVVTFATSPIPILLQSTRPPIERGECQIELPLPAAAVRPSLPVSLSLSVLQTLVRSCHALKGALPDMTSKLFPSQDVGPPGTTGTKSANSCYTRQGGDRGEIAGGQ